MGKFDSYVKATSWYKNKYSEGGGGGGAGAFVQPEPTNYEPVNFDLYLKTLSPEIMSQKQDIILKLEKDYEEITPSIDKNYELYKDFTKQLDDLEIELGEAPDELKWSLTQKYNTIKDEHNKLVEILQRDTEKQKAIYQQYTEIRETFDRDVEIYNKKATAQNNRPPEKIKEIPPVDIGEQFTSEAIAQQLKDVGYYSPTTRPAMLDLDRANKYVAAPIKGIIHGIYSTPQSVGGIMRLIGENMQENGTPNIFQGDEDKYTDLMKAIAKKPEKDSVWFKPIGESLTNKSQEIINANRKFLSREGLEPDPDDKVAKWLFQLGSGTTSLAGAVGISLLTGSPHAAAIAFGIYQAGGEYQKAREAEAKVGRATATALVSGTIEGALEYIGLEFLFTKFGGNFWVERLLHAGIEGFQEFAQKLGENLVARIGYDKLRSALDGCAESASIGAVLGGGASAIIGNIEKDIDLTELSPEEKKGLITAIVQKQFEAITKILPNLSPIAIMEKIRSDPELQKAMAGVFEREAEVEAFAYKAEPIKPNIENLKKELAGRMTKERIFLEEIEEAIGKKIDIEKPEDIRDALFFMDKITGKTDVEVLPEEKLPKAKSQEPGEIFKGKAWRAETFISNKMETAQSIVDFDAEELGNTYTKEDAEKVAQKLGLNLKEIKGEDVVWVTKTKEEAKEYGQPEKYEITKDNIILAKDPTGGYLILKNADKYKKVEPKVEITPKVEPKFPKFAGEAGAGEGKVIPSDTIRSDYIDKAEENNKVPTKQELFESDDLVITRKVGDKITYYEQWIDSCWQALYKKPEYKGLSRTDAIKKFVEERFKVIAKDKDLKIDDWKYTNSILTVKLSPEITPTTTPTEQPSAVEAVAEKAITTELEIGKEEIEAKRAKEYKILPEPNYTNLVEGQILIDKAGIKWDLLSIINKEEVPAKWKYEIKRQDLDQKMVKPLGEIERYFKIKDVGMMVGGLFAKKAVIDIPKEIPVEEVGIKPPVPPVPPKKTAEKPVEPEPKKSLEELLKDAQKEINRLKGIIKTIKGNKEKRAEFKKELVAYIKKNMPYAIQNKMLSAVKNVTGDKALEQAMEMVDQYTLEHYRREYIKKIKNELTAKKIEPKKSKSGILKGRFTPEIQDKLDFIGANINGSRSEAIKKIQENINLFNKGEAINIAEENELLNMIGINDMDLETLQLTLANIKSLKTIGKTIRQKMAEENRKRHEQDIIKSIETITGKKVEIDKETGKAKLDSSYKTLPKTKEWGKIRKAIDGIVNWQFGWDNLLDKLSFFDKKSKPYQSELSKIGDIVHYARVENMRSLEDVLAMIQFKFAEAFESTSKKDIMKTCQKLREEVDLGEFKNSEGSLVHLVLTKEQILKKVMQLDDPSLASTFEDGMLFTEEIEEAFRKSVTPKEMAYIKGIKEVYDYMWERINPIFEEMYGIHFPRNPFYSGTIRRDVDINITEASLMAQDAFRYASILNPSLKARTKSKATLKYDDLTGGLMHYVMQMEHFINWAKPLQDLRSVFGDRRVRSVIGELYGGNVLKTINGFLDDMTRDGVEKSKIMKSLDKIRFNFTRAILAKPHIGIKQIPSVLAYMTEIPVGDFFKGVANFWKNPIVNFRYLVEHSPYAKERFGKGFERDIHGAMQQDYVHLMANTKKIADLMMGMVRAGDAFAVMQGMWATFYSETNGQCSKASNTNVENAMMRATIATERTQPSFSVESLATGQRGGSLLKLFTMFQNQPNKYFRLIADNARNFRAGRGSRVKAASNIVLAWVILPMLFQFISDGGKWIKKHQMRAFLLGGINNILVFGAMIRSMYGWLIEEAYGLQESPVFGTFREIEFCLAKVAKYLDPDRDITPEDIQKFCEHFAKGIGQVVGLPTPYAVQVSQAIRDKDVRQLLYSKYILDLKDKEPKKKKPYVKSYAGEKYSKYLKGKYNQSDKYSKYLKKY